ncbi:hypothetical protein LY78DRAFT_458250 [Colletotrichum sublineola]|nr:hypothetical protein LY78DRAFT_458250 [Colletotrichum sublineola]
MDGQVTLFIRKRNAVSGPMALEAETETNGPHHLVSRPAADRGFWLFFLFFFFSLLLLLKPGLSHTPTMLFVRLEWLGDTFPRRRTTLGTRVEIFSGMRAHRGRINDDSLSLAAARREARRTGSFHFFSSFFFFLTVGNDDGFVYSFWFTPQRPKVHR